MKASTTDRETPVKKKTSQRFIVRKPSTLKDYQRVYRFSKEVVKKAKELEKAFHVPA